MRLFESLSNSLALPFLLLSRAPNSQSLLLVPPPSLHVQESGQQEYFRVTEVGPGKMAAPLELSCWGGGWGLPSVHSESLVVMVRPPRGPGRGRTGLARCGLRWGRTDGQAGFPQASTLVGLAVLSPSTPARPPQTDVPRSAKPARPRPRTGEGRGRAGCLRAALQTAQSKMSPCKLCFRRMPSFRAHP